MTRLAALLGLIGLGLLLVSLAPWPAAAGQQTNETTPLETTAAAAQGRALFLAKGCATCHHHDALGEQSGGVDIGPDLSNYQPDPDFAARWLRDPAAIRPGTNMPNLNLSDDEIAALITFLTTPLGGSS